MENIYQAGQYNKISPTAKITAYWRSMSDIPFSKEIADATGAGQTARQMLGGRMDIMAHLSPLIFEARYKAIDYGLKKSKVDHVLEMACGLSPRGLRLASENIKYVGTDLPEILSESQPAMNITALISGVPMQNIHFQPANVLDKEQLADAAGYFEGERLGICNEGLLMYLNRDEKAIMAENIRDLLLPGNGCWVTTDIVFGDIRKKLLATLTQDLKKTVETILGNISNQVQRDILGNDFKDEPEAMAFYENLGFNIERYPFYEGSYPLSTLSDVPEVMQEPILNILKSSMSWIMTPKHI